MKLLIYIPAVVTYVGFTYFPGINPDQYNMVKTHLGWINVAVNNGWDWFYMAYYIGYSLAGYYMVWQWGRKSKNIKIKKESYLILFSFLSTMILASLTDIMGNVILSESIPQLAPILMIFPIITIFYAIKKFGFMNPRHVDEDAILMTDQIRVKIINYTANSFLAVGVLNFISQYLLSDRTNLQAVLIFSGFLVSIGVLFQVIQRSVKNKDLKDVLNALVFSIIVPVVTLKFMDHAGVTIWAFPFILLIITLVFEKGFIQIALIVSILLTQIIVWVIKPEIVVKIDGSHHVARLGFLVISIWFILFIKKIYQSKLNENAAQISSQKLITEISSDFVSVNERNMDDKANRALMKAGSFAKSDRMYLYLLDGANENLWQKYGWINQEKTTASCTAEIMNVREFPFIMQYLQSGRTIALSDMTEVEAEIGEELSRLLNSCEKSVIIIPILINNVLFGFFGMDAVQKTKRWHDSQIGFHKIISNIFADAFEKVNQEKEINFMAFYDQLTKLPNRALFEDRVTQAINLSRRTNKILSVIYIDIDAFKYVNDSVGHEGGDDLLVRISEKLSKLIRKSDALSRFGGDEFIIMLNDMNSTNDIVKIINKILNLFDNPFVIHGQEFFVTASAGVAVYPFDGEDAEMLISNADIAMYKAKEQGKKQYLFCTSDMKEDILLKRKLSNSLYRALDRAEFELHYQPQICAKTKKIIGAEALIRWNHPELGLIPPNVFIPLAEQTGLIGPIGEWVLRTACAQCKAWQSLGLPTIRMAVNVSILQFRNPDIVSQIKRAIDDNQLAPEYLELEITESAAVNEATYILTVLDAIKKLGISIAIDDFGTEYSSLSRLTSMPIDRIKMDIQFVRGISKSEKENAIVKGIIGLAHNLGLRVIAEGVETPLQLNFLCEKECDEIQGYYFYHPVRPDDLEKILRQSV